MGTPLADQRDHAGLLGHPRTAGREAPEDRGQRYAEDKSASELSDKYPAGPGCTPAHDAPAPAGRSSSARINRGVSVDVRFTTAERAAIDRRASALGVKRSQWVRTALLDALDSRRDGLGALETAAATPAPRPELADAVEQLRRVGVNLNQAVRRISSDGQDVLEDDLLREVAQAVDEVRARLGDRTAL